MAVTYRTRIAQTGRNTGIPVPDEVLDQLGGGRRPKVAADINDYQLRTSLGSMGGVAMISFSAAHREASGLSGGDEVTVTLRLDDAPADVAVPPDLAAALAASAEARRQFDALAASYQRNFVTQVEAAKQPQTRARRIASTIAKLEAGEKR